MADGAIAVEGMTRPLMKSKFNEPAKTRYALQHFQLFGRQLAAHLFVWFWWVSRLSLRASDSWSPSSENPSEVNPSAGIDDYGSRVQVLMVDSSDKF